MAPLQTNSPPTSPDRERGIPLPVIESLYYKNFRNLKENELQFHPRFNIFWGQNGQGKTNLLEALHLLITLKPLRNVRQNQLITWGEKSASLRGTVSAEKKTELAVEITRQGKNILIDRLPAQIEPYLSLYSAVAFTPDDLNLVKGPPELRRKYLDRLIFHSQTSYIREYKTYLKILNQRNALLKQREPSQHTLLKILEGQLVQVGSSILQRRVALFAELNRRLAPSFQQIFPELTEEFSTRYRSSLGVTISSRDPHEQYLETSFWTELWERHFQKNRERELERGTTLAGPHLDELEFLLYQRPFKIAASQGQTRGLALALKITEIQTIRERRNQNPILILDDLGGELDPQHTQLLLQYLKKTKTQTFISTTSRELIPLLNIRDSLVFSVVSGKISPQLEKKFAR